MARKWIEAADNYVCLHTETSHTMIRETMKSMESRLDPAGFVRLHRSIIVDINKVKELKPLPNGDYEVKMQSRRMVRMSRTYRDEVLRRLR